MNMGLVMLLALAGGATVTLVLVITAFICTIASAWNPSKVPLWIPVLLLCIIALLQVLPK